MLPVCSVPLRIRSVLRPCVVQRLGQQPTLRTTVCGLHTARHIFFSHPFRRSGFSTPARFKTTGTERRTSRSGPQSPPPVESEESDTTEASPEARLRTVLQRESKEVEEHTKGEYNEFISEHDAKVTVAGNDVTVTFSNDNYNFRLKFCYEPETDVDAEFDAEEEFSEDIEDYEDKHMTSQRKPEEDVEQDEDDSEKDNSETLRYNFSCDIERRNSQSPVMRVNAYVQGSQSFYIDSIQFGRSFESLDKADAEAQQTVGVERESSGASDPEYPGDLSFGDLSEDLQDGIADFLDSIGLDDSAGRFVQECAWEQQRLAHLNMLTHFQNFIA